MRPRLLPCLLAGSLLVARAPARADGGAAPPPASVTGDVAGPLPCRIVREVRTRVVCEGGLLETKTLRELSILRNAIYARYGFAGFRKAWLREHFAAQPWYQPDPSFTYKRLSDVDKKNGHLIAVYEHSLTEADLSRRKDDVYARRGKVWDDVPRFRLRGGRTVRACEEPKDLDPDADHDPFALETSRDCRYREAAWYRPDPGFRDGQLTREDRIELGLIARAMGSFALDEDAREAQAGSLDRVLSIADLRKLSLRDLRILRNTIYARRGRPFRSQVLRDHFAGMSWYRVEPRYTDRRLTKSDQRNIRLIKSVENEFGGPLRDEDWLQEPAVDGA